MSTNIKLKMFQSTCGAEFVFPGTRSVDASAFTEENGYGADDIEAISALEVGEEWQSSLHPTHTIKRVS